MNDLGWRADGIERAMAAGAIVLERYHRPGFAATDGVRRCEGQGTGGAVPVDWGWDDGEPKAIRPDPDPR